MLDYLTTAKHPVLKQNLQTKLFTHSGPWKQPPWDWRSKADSSPFHGNQTSNYVGQNICV
jgi:hypothetical protein